MIAIKYDRWNSETFVWKDGVCVASLVGGLDYYLINIYDGDKCVYFKKVDAHISYSEEELCLELAKLCTIKERIDFVNDLPAYEE